MAQISNEPSEFTSYGLSCVRWVPAPMQRPDHHNEIQINMLRKGRVTYLLGSSTVHIKANHLTAFWAAIPHQIIDYSGDTDYFVATIPLAWFIQCRLPERLTVPLMHGEVVSEPFNDRAESDFAVFAQWQQDLAEGGPVNQSIVLLEVEARLRRLSKSLPPLRQLVPDRSDPGIQSGGLNRVEHMACIVAQRYTEPLTVPEISKAVGLHPNYAMNLFKKAFGTTLIEYLTNHRVSHAQRLLATTDKKIVDIAFSSGFNSMSRFNEAFREACGCTPREYRLAHQFSDSGQQRWSP